MYKKLDFTLLILGFVFLSSLQLNADILYLKNGRQIQGIINSEDERIVDLEVCAGRVQFTKGEIERIERSGPEELEELRQKCQRQKAQNERELLKQQVEKEKEDKGARLAFSEESQSIIVQATLNKKVKAKLVLDTGASLVMLRKDIAEKLGIDLNKLKSDMEIQLADGRKVNAKYIILDSVDVEYEEAKNIEAAILLDDMSTADIKDGLLGRSFLKNFNFKVDYRNKKLTLEKL